MTDQTTPTPTLDEAVARMNAGMAALRVALDALLPLTERSTAAAAKALGELQDGWDARREAAAARPYSNLRDEMDRVEREEARARALDESQARVAELEERLRGKASEARTLLKERCVAHAELNAARARVIELRAEVASLERGRAALGADRDQWRQAYEATGAPGGAAAVEQLRAQLAMLRQGYDALARPVRQPVPAGVLDEVLAAVRADDLGDDAAVARVRRDVIGELWCRWDDAPGVYPGQAMVWLQEVNDAMHQVVADARRTAEIEAADASEATREEPYENAPAPMPQVGAAGEAEPRSDLDDFPVGYTIGCAVPGCRVEWTATRVADGSWRAEADADPRKMKSSTPGPGYADAVSAGLVARSKAVRAHDAGRCACEPGAAPRGETWRVELDPDGRWTVIVGVAAVARADGLDNALKVARGRAIMAEAGA